MQRVSLSLSAVLAAWALLTIPASPSAHAAEIGYIENYSLATDRTIPLKQLIPGTEEYYYYHALHYQNTEQWDKHDELLAAWIARYKYTGRVIEIENRRALLTYTKNPQRTLDLITNRLNLQFNHQRDELNQKPNLPTTLDGTLLVRERLMREALGQYGGTVQGFENSALDWLIAQELNPEQRRDLLSRLQRPDYPNLVKLVLADLDYRYSGGFGQFPIHGQMLLSQLDELAKLKPDLRNQVNFVNAYLKRLQPSDDVNWRQDQKALAGYLERVWNYVEKLEPVHNSLKAHILYQRLVLERAQGVYDPEKFLTYIKLPRACSYIEPVYMQSETHRKFPANLGQDFTSITMMPTIGDDEPLVRSYLEHFFVDAEDYKNYTPYIRDTYLRHVFAETKVVNGIGDPEKWYSYLPPDLYQRIKERIDLDFAYTNRTEVASDESVSLDLYVKNVGTLIVKVFEINTQNYYRENLKEVGPDINLDGLVANEEKTYTYQDPPVRRVKRHFDFASLNKRGVYVIDFIGNGKSSRALIRKGKLRFLVRTGVAGQVFKVFDELNKPVTAATLWLAGSLYTPDKDGAIATPFTNQPGRQPIVLSIGGFSSLDFFQQENEDYQLSAAIHVDREQLLSLRKAKLIVRPRLTLSGTPVLFKVLEEVRLVIHSVDLDNVASTKEVADFKLYEDRESVYEFQVPKRLASIRFQLKAKVQNHSQNKKIDLSTEESFAINEIDRTDKTEDLHFSRIAGGYVIDVLGKTGEAKPDRPVQLNFKLRDFKQPQYASLQSSNRGRIVLGPLPGVATVTATNQQGVSHVWHLAEDEHTYPQILQAEAGQPVEVAYMGGKAKPERSEVSLLELRGDNFLADRFDAITVNGGLFQIDKLPPGDYSLLIKPDTHVKLRLTEGPRNSGYVMGDYRKLEVKNAKPLALKPVEVTDAGIKIELQNASDMARVHVFATRFRPAFSAYNSLASIVPAEPYLITTPRISSQYEAGRNIGDEYRYIIDRKFARKYPGNMLERPSLLLNPWAIRSTQTGEQVAQGGDNFGGRAMKSESGMDRSAGGGRGVAAQADFSNLDFLAVSSLLLLNAAPDDKGVLEIKRNELASKQDLMIVAVDGDDTVCRIIALPEDKVDYLDLRLAKGLDPKQHYTQQKRITVLPAKATLTVPDISSTRFESYDNLARVYGLFSTLNTDPKFAEFGFIRTWPTLKAEEKKKLYLKYASHELHFFLYKKDPEFFKQTVKPYLANKKNKQFVDRWLLEENLTEYLKSWNFEQLNTFERILLAQRIQGEQSTVARLVREQYELLPPDVERFNMLFQTALKGNALDTGDPLGLREAQEKAEDPQLLRAEMDEARDAVAAGPAARAALAPGMVAPAGPPGKNRPARQLAANGKEAAKSLEQRAKKDAGGEGKGEGFADDREMLKRVQPYYRKLDKTMEWVESNYFQLPIEQQDSSLITSNSFWKDYAAHDPANPFYASNIANASRNAHEMLMALALLDLPFTASEHKTEFKGTTMTLVAGSPMIVFHEEIQQAAKVAEFAPILVSQNYYRIGERHKQVNNEQVDKFVSEEFLVDTVFGCHIVVTNPTSSRKKVDVLMQIPTGAMPVSNGQNTKSVHLDLQPYHTQTLEYFFYFPSIGKYPHYPVQVAAGGEVLAYGQPFTFNVVSELTNVDKDSWDYISQHGTPEDVLAFLRNNNVLRVNLDRIAWRMQDRSYFETITSLLASRHIYNNTLWSYGVKHNHVPTIKQFLQFADTFVAQCGQWIDSPLLVIDPVVRRSYEHMDYKPLVNARVGQLGRHREILNDRFFAQYQRLLKILTYRRTLDSNELMSVTYYLLLQDRVEEALATFARVDAGQLQTRLQYDYFSAYMNFYKAEPKLAKTTAAKYADYPVERWRLAFANITSQADEIEKQDLKVVDVEDRTQVQTNLAANTASFEFTVESQKVKIHYQKLTEVKVNYYLMDIELLFSRNPFVQHDSKQFSHILPNLSQTVALPKGVSFEFPLPEKLANSNVLVEIVGDGQTQSQAYYSNSLRVQLIENYGQVRVAGGKDVSALPKVYVKVYARMKDGDVRFYKDGYTDLRGRFDYTSLNTDELEQVDRFSLLILSEEQGAIVREAKPPKR